MHSCDKYIIVTEKYISSYIHKIYIDIHIWNCSYNKIILVKNSVLSCFFKRYDKHMLDIINDSFLSQQHLANLSTILSSKSEN